MLSDDASRAPLYKECSRCGQVVLIHSNHRTRKPLKGRDLGSASRCASCSVTLAGQRIHHSVRPKHQAQRSRRAHHVLLGEKLLMGGIMAKRNASLAPLCLQRKVECCGGGDSAGGECDEHGKQRNISTTHATTHLPCASRSSKGMACERRGGCEGGTRARRGLAQAWAAVSTCRLDQRPER